MVNKFSEKDRVLVINKPQILKKRDREQYAGRAGEILGEFSEFYKVKLDSSACRFVLFLASELEPEEPLFLPELPQEAEEGPGDETDGGSNSQIFLLSRLKTLGVLGNVCPHCGLSNKSRVLETRRSNTGGLTRRRRECLACEGRFSMVSVRVDDLKRLIDQAEGEPGSLKSKHVRGVISLLKQAAYEMELSEE